MSTVFISYRRENTAGEARALFNDLAERLGEKSVFMDVDSIALGRDFRTVLQETTASCDLMLVLIGRNWAAAKDEGGRTRLENPDDYVRLEIETALRRNIPVTPVLVQGAHMPAPEELPPEIKNLAYRNGFELGHTRWESDVREMTRRLSLDAPTVPPPQPKTKRWAVWALIPALVVVASFVGLWKSNLIPSIPPAPSPAQPTEGKPGPHANLTPSTSPAPLPAATTEGGAGGADARAKEYEAKGFAALLAHNFDEAYRNFGESARIFPTLHNVEEIRGLLIQQKPQLQSTDPGAWKRLFSTILDRYPWGMPADVKAQMEAQR